jgi:hypothetical protein
VKLLDSEAVLVRLETRVSELVSVLSMEFFSARLELNVNEPVSALKMEFFSARVDVRVIELVGFRVQAVATPACSVHETDVVLET